MGKKSNLSRAEARRPAGSATPAPRGRAKRKGVAGLDRLIHERVRLGIVSALAVNDSLTFAELRRGLQALGEWNLKRQSDLGRVHLGRNEFGWDVGPGIKEIEGQQAIGQWNFKQEKATFQAEFL